MGNSLEKAQEIVKSNFVRKGLERLPLDKCIGKTLAEDVLATMSQPPFRRSAMDGYCIRKEEVISAEDVCRLEFKVTGEIDAGDTNDYKIKEKEALRIMTGAKLPQGANLVIRQEDAVCSNGMVKFKQISNRDNICPIGEDFKKGDVLAKKGQTVDAYVLSCVAASGFTHLNVYRPLGIALISTGDELRELGEALKEGQIYNSNVVYLAARLNQYDCEIVSKVYVKDSLNEIIQAIEEASQSADYIITTGGVSVGTKDFMEQALESLGAEIMFHGIDIKPGMPTMFSVIKETPVLSLSGNPYSASAVFELLFPLFAKLQVETVLCDEYKAVRYCPRIVRGYFNGYGVHIPENQKNGVIQTGVGTNCLVYLAQGKTPLAAKSKVMISLL